MNGSISKVLHKDKGTNKDSGIDSRFSCMRIQRKKNVSSERAREKQKSQGLDIKKVGDRDNVIKLSTADNWQFL